VGAALSIVRLDLRAIRRDRVALATVLLSVLGTALVTGLGAFQDRLPGWADRFPLLVAVSLLGGPAGVGFLFGLLMIEEADTGVRDALAVTPVPVRGFVVVRTAVATLWMVAWPLASVYLMNATWRVLDLGLVHWLTLLIPLALFTPSLALAIPALANDKVGALAVFKVLAFVSLLPLASFVIPADAGYRFAFLLSPTGWTVEAYRALLAERFAAALLWSLGAMGYALSLLVIVVNRFERKVRAAW